MKNFKRTTALIMALISVFTLVAFGADKATTIVMKIGSSQALINGADIVISEADPSVTPVIVNGSTYVPVEFINTHFNTKIDVKTVTTVEEDGITLVPLRKLAEEMGYNVYYKDSVIVISSDKNAKAPADKTIAEYSAKLTGLPVVGTQAKLNALVNSNPQLLVGSMKEGVGIAVSEPAMDSGAANIENKTVVFESARLAESSIPTGAASAPQASTAPMAAPTAAAAPSMGESQSQVLADVAVEEEADFSATNTQVKGVDEGDIIKTDGSYIYFSPGYGDHVSIIKAVPGNDMKEVKRIEFGDYIINDMYLNDKQLIVIANGYKNKEMAPYPVSISSTPREAVADVMVDSVMPYMPYYMGKATTKVFVYDTTNMANVKEVKTFEIEGSINSSRKIGNNLYLITRSYLSESGVNNGEYKFDLPKYTDSATGKEKSLDLATLCYLPESISRGITVITGIKLNDLKSEALNTSYLGDNEAIHMSTDNLYITTTSYNYNYNRSFASTSRTNIYKFALDNGKTTFTSRGKVDGSPLNQFSMDEYDGYFRIATTTWATSGGRSNNMFVLDKNLNKTGQITNIAPNETIQSVRFLGDKAHMVTFEVVDPLFVIDLKNPAKPAILGELKIPGYSTYLHPYDENHLIGFGYDADNEGNTRGIKISMFDISDLSNPKEKFTTVIGDRGTSSDLLHNHKALLFSKEKNLLAFPIEIRTLSAAEKNDRWAYGKFAFQGAYVYSIDMEKGFVLGGSISNDEKKIDGNYNEYVQRILYIEDMLYTASNQSVVATDLNSFVKQGKVEIN